MEKEDLHIEKKDGISIGSAVIVAGVLIAGAVMFASMNNQDASTVSTADTVAIPPVSDDDFIWGADDAKITLVEYADFSCSYCARYHPVMKRIVEEYEGRVRWVYRHLPIFNKPAAVASECVGHALGDEKFFVYADTLYANQDDIDQDLLKREALLLGMDEALYDSCVEDQDLNDRISREFSTTRILAGFNATPYTVLIDQKGNMYPFSGALPYEDVVALIESFL